MGRKNVTIEIKNNEEFTNLPKHLKETLSVYGDESVDIEIKLGEGDFYFGEKFINLNGAKKDGIKISITGVPDKTFIYGLGCEIENDSVINNTNHSIGFVTTQKKPQKKPNFFKRVWGKILKIFGKKLKEKVITDYPSYFGSKFYEADELIKVVDADNKICKLIYKKLDDIYEGDPTISKEHQYIQVTQWFKCETYKVQDINLDEGYVTFKCTDLEYRSTRNQWSINNNFIFSKGKYMPKFRLSCTDKSDVVSVNPILLPDGVEKAYACFATCFLYVKNSAFNGIELSNLYFKGNAGKHTNSGESLISVEKGICTNDILIKDCHFDNIHSDVIRINNSTSATISNCMFEYCWRYGAYINEGQRKDVIEWCKFRNCGLDNTNSFCVKVDSTDFVVQNNSFRNYGCIGIAVGTWWATEDRVKNCGIVCDNVLINDKGYNVNLMDSGAIYVYSQNDSVTITRNVVSNYVGLMENRGIFCDDGASGFALIDNNVSDTPNSFSIDSWRAKYVETDPKSKLTAPANIRNKIVGNHIDGALRFEGNHQHMNDVEGCYLGTNFRPKKYNNKMEDVIVDIYDCESAVFLEP